MDGEFTAYCKRYWRLRDQMLIQEEEFTVMANNAPVYNGQRQLSELDEILSYNRKAQKLRGETDKTIMQLRETESILLKIFKYFDLLPWQMVYAEFPGEFEFAVSYDEEDLIHAVIIKMLDPIPENPNIMTIKIPGPGEKVKY